MDGWYAFKDQVFKQNVPGHNFLFLSFLSAVSLAPPFEIEFYEHVPCVHKVAKSCAAHLWQWEYLLNSYRQIKTIEFKQILKLTGWSSKQQINDCCWCSTIQALINTNLMPTIFCDPVAMHINESTRAFNL